MYHKLTKDDCLSVATTEERDKLNYITDIFLLKELAERWCKKNKRELGGYLGNNKWDTWNR